MIVEFCCQGPVQVAPQTFPLERSEARSVLFTEQEAFWTLPLHETAVLADVAVAKGTAVPKIIPTVEALVLGFTSLECMF